MGRNGSRWSGKEWGPLAELAGTPAEAVTPGQHQGPPTGAMGTPEQHHGPLEEVVGTPSSIGDPRQEQWESPAASGTPERCSGDP